MNVSSELLTRSGNQCELCGSSDDLTEVVVSPKSGEDLTEIAVCCSPCADAINSEEMGDPNNWKGLLNSMWSEVPSVQVLSYRLLNKLKNEDWAVEALNMMYLDDATLEWAQNSGNIKLEPHFDSNGQELQTGDTVILTQDLNVKGANFTAKKGLVVKKIRLVHDNPEQIEAKVEGQQIVILTKFVKKA